MPEQSRQDQLFECLLHVIARAAIPVEAVNKVVGDAKNQRRAFNLCDGSRTLGAIASAAGINQGNLSRTVARWVSEGVVFKLGEGRELRPLYVYPLPGVGSRSRRKRAVLRGRKRR
jgi:hypothetical protein